MNFDDVIQLWKSQPLPPTDSPAAQLDAVRHRARAFHRRIVRRDALEIVTGIFLMGIFGFVAWHVPGALFWGCIALIAAVGFVTLFFLFDRRIQRGRSTHQGETPVRELERAVAAIEHQIWLLRNIFWWYILPLLVGEVALALAMAIEVPVAVGSWLPFYATICIAVNAFVFWLNRHAARRLQPERGELRALLEEWRNAETGPSSSEA